MNLSQDELLSQLRQMDEYEFEQLVADMWERWGWETTVTTSSGDSGIDVIAEKNSPFSQKHLIQAKRYSVCNKVGSPDIQQYSSLKQQENNVDAVVVVTTSSFTKQAERAAGNLNVKMIDGNDIHSIISETDDCDIIKKYISTYKANSIGQKNKSQVSPDSGRQKTNAEISPFDSKRGWTRVSSTMRAFPKCPECSSDDVWGAELNHQTEYVRCADCGSAWKEVEEENGTTSSKTVKEWKEYEGPNSGTLKTTSDWMGL